MATAEATNIPNGTAPTPGDSRSRGGRNRGRGGQGHGGSSNDDRGMAGQTNGDNSSGRSRGRGRGGNRGRGGRNRAGSHSQTMTAPNEQDSTTNQPPPLPGGTGVFGNRLTKDAEDTPQEGESKQSSANTAEEDVEAEVCFICASPVSHNSVAPCNHRTCHICALRLRALYKNKTCAHCRTEAETVIFTDDPEKRYEDFVKSDFARKDENLGIAYERQEIFEDTVLLLRYNCPDPSCDVACMGWPDLHRHVRSAHGKVMCDLCTRNKKVFTHEHELFTQAELKKHEKFGDDNPGAVDQSGFKGHPECGFCRKRFYGDDELLVHCRENHERCHLCDRRTGGQSPQYFQNYAALEQHFNHDHFPCLDSECLEKKFVVFDSQMDLKAHQLEAHPNGLSKDARRDARRVDISAFDYRPQYQEPRRGGGGRRGGRGRDPNSEPMPAASGGHMSRAEIAHQREREIQSAQSVTSRTFGGQLTRPEPQAQTVNRPAASPQPANAQPAFPALNAQSAPPPAAEPARPFSSMTPQEQARHLRHNAVTERAANLLGNDQVKLTEFRERVSSFRSSAITARELIDAFFSLFDTSATELGKLIKELADIFEAAGKRDALLKSWNDWRAINEDYPSLPGPSGAGAGGPTTAASVLGAGKGGSRVLKLKSSTAQSSRSAIGGQRSWKSHAGGVGAGSSSSSKGAFPALPSSANGARTSGNAPPAPTPSWLALRPAAAAGGNSAAGSVSSSARASPAPSRTQSSANIKGADAFPALPPGKKPTSTVFSPGYRGTGVLRPNTSASAANAWGAAGGSGSGTATPVPSAMEPEVEVGGGGKGKGKKKGKQVVFQWG